MFACILSGTCVAVANLKILIESRSWNVPFTASVFVSIAFFVGFTLSVQQVWDILKFIGDSGTFRAYLHALSGECALPTLLSNFLIIFVSLLPDLVHIIYRFMTLDGTLSLWAADRHRVNPERYSLPTCSYAVNGGGSDVISARSDADFVTLRQFNNADVELKQIRPKSS